MCCALCTANILVCCCGVGSDRVAGGGVSRVFQFFKLEPTFAEIFTLFYCMQLQVQMPKDQPPGTWRGDQHQWAMW